MTSINLTSDQQGMVDAFRQVLDEAMLKMVSTMQRPTVIASESGVDSMTTKKLASGEIQWELHLYAKPDEDHYEFIEASSAITEQVYSYYGAHTPGQPLPRLQLQRAADTGKVDLLPALKHAREYVAAIHAQASGAMGDDTPIKPSLDMIDASIAAAEGRDA